MSLCVITGCADPGQHHDDCTSQQCRACRPRYAEHGQVCNSHVTRLAAELDEIRQNFAELAAKPDPVDRAQWTVRVLVPVPTTDRRQLPAWVRIEQPGREQLAQILPMGITRSSRHGARVSGSREAPVPVNLDHIDLTGEARAASVDVKYRKGWSHKPDGDPDQIGHLPVATELDFWVRDWAEVRGQGEHLPVPTVAELATWLANRRDWACANHPAIDEFATKIGQIRGALRSALGLTAAPKERCEGVECKACDRMALYRDGALVSCGYCGQHYSERDYREWVGLLAGRARRIAA